MNSAINTTLQQYLDTFMDTVAERFEISRDDLNNLWKETQKKKFSKKNKSSKRKKSSVPSAYILFCHDERPKIKDNHPDLSFAEIAKELGRRWNKATDSIKEHYKKQHDILLQQYQEQNTNAATTNTTTVDATSDDDEVASTTSEAIVADTQEEEKPKKPKKNKAVEIPEEITNERERALWPEFAKLTISDLRTKCDHNNIKKSKNRNDMIHALVAHRIALEDGNTQIDSDEED